MSDGQSFYTFLPWLRTGVGAQLAQSATGAGRASVALQLEILGDGAVQDTVQRNVELYGPGDVLGVNNNTIIRTVPRAGTHDFEANFLAAIDFYDEDFPWRYSPAAPNGDRVAPWLWLLVLEEGEFDLLSPIAGSLPVVLLHEGVINNAFPKPQQSWAWAHTHLNFKVAEENSDLNAALRNAQTELSNNPNLGCSRLISPRRLKEEKGYTAFLIPAFETGRLAGLGVDHQTIETIPAMRVSWELPQSNPPNQFPVYYHWSFSTMKGEFEQLASKITPVTEAELRTSGVGVPLTMDIHSPGWGVTHQDPKRAIRIPSVFRLSSSPEDPQFPAQGPVNDDAWVDRLAQLLNLSIDMQEAHAEVDQENPIYADGNKIKDDPVVTPPVYGSWYVKPPIRLDKIKMGSDWFHQMNLNPGLRVIGGVGAEVIRDNQEEYMERAWEQYEEIRETNRFISMAQLSSKASTAMLSKHFGATLDSFSRMDPSNEQVRGLRLAAMSRSARVFEAVQKQTEVFSWTSPVAMKMFRPQGALMRRVAGTAPTAPVGDNVWLKGLEAKVFQHENAHVSPLDLIVMNLTTRAVFDPNHLGTANRIKGLAPEKVQSALETHKSYFFPLVSILFVPIKVNSNMREQFQADDAIRRKVNARLPVTARTDSPTNKVELLRVEPDFPEPMFDELARQSLDFVIPGVEKFPVNRCGMFLSNRNAIESFLIGLNHEMAREMLWREFPANLTFTFFRQFWDKNDQPTNTPANAASFKDITPIREWGSPTPLGDELHRVGTNIDPLFFVLRGDLLRKYPNTVVFMQRAKLSNGVKVPDTATDAIRMPIAGARIEPDIFFVGFNVSKNEATGNPGWFIVFQERPGDLHFGLDQNDDVSPGAPDWKNADTEPGHCIDTDKSLFANLQHAADVATFTYQQPFMMLIHASKMLA